MEATIVPDKPSGPQQSYVKSPANQIGKSEPVEVNVHTAPPMKIEKMAEAPPNSVLSRVGPA